MCTHVNHVPVISSCPLKCFDDRKLAPKWKKKSVITRWAFLFLVVWHVFLGENWLICVQKNKMVYIVHRRPLLAINRHCVMMPFSLMLRKLFLKAQNQNFHRMRQGKHHVHILPLPAISRPCERPQCLFLQREKIHWKMKTTPLS